MKKKILVILFSLVIGLCVSVPAFAAQTDGFASEYERVQDLADLLSDSEEAALLTKLDELCERQKMEIVVLTTDTLEGMTPRDYADDMYDYSGFGYGEDRDGALLLISMEDNDWYISTQSAWRTMIGTYPHTATGLRYLPTRESNISVSRSKRICQAVIFQEPLTNSSGFATISSQRQEPATPTIRTICPKSRLL